MSEVSQPRLGPAILFAVYEYVLVVMPVALYVFLHSLHAESLSYTLTYSADWNIATIFLAAQGQSLYRFEAENKRRHNSRSASGLFTLSAILLIVLAASNIQIGLSHPSYITALCMWVLFVISSVAFLLMITGARFVASRFSQGREDD